MLYRFSCISILILFTILTLTGCAAYSTSPVLGALVTNVQAPLTVGSGMNPQLMKVGTGTATSLLGIIAFGDASIRTAAKEAGIKKIHYVDYHSEKFIIIARFTIYVYGE